jgi:hypothetical protein
MPMCVANQSPHFPLFRLLIITLLLKPYVQHKLAAKIKSTSIVMQLHEQMFLPLDTMFIYSTRLCRTSSYICLPNCGYALEIHSPNIKDLAFERQGSWATAITLALHTLAGRGAYFCIIIRDALINCHFQNRTCRL